MQKIKNVTVTGEESIHFLLETAIKIFALIFVHSSLQTRNLLNYTY